MVPKRFTGPGAGSQKYDLLTAMAVAGLAGTQGFHNSMLRLIALVTARYDWKSDELTTGQREIARLWSVDERTVKREIKRLTESAVLLQLRPGIRGRVAAYRLNYNEIYRLSEPVWNNVGSDYAARMSDQKPATSPKVVHLDFSRNTGGTAEPGVRGGGGTPWDRVRDRLALSDPGLFQSWYSALDFVGYDSSTLTLSAPNSFQAQYIQTHHLKGLAGAARLEFGAVTRVSIEARSAR